MNAHLRICLVVAGLSNPAKVYRKSISSVRNADGAQRGTLWAVYPHYEGVELAEERRKWEDGLSGQWEMLEPNQADTSLHLYGWALESDQCSRPTVTGHNAVLLQLCPNVGRKMKDVGYESVFNFRA